MATAPSYIEEQSIPRENGLLALILGVPAMLLWIVYCRIVVELLAAVFRAAQVITNSQG